MDYLSIITTISAISAYTLFVAYIIYILTVFISNMNRKLENTAKYKDKFFIFCKCFIAILLAIILILFLYYCLMKGISQW